jgi:2-oxoisovalerate dehydrogenase E1 component beta subunit
MVWTALEAAGILAQDGVSAEVLDLRTLLPLDEEAILGSVGRTGKCIVLHEDTRTGGLGAEIAATLSEKAFASLDGPILRVTAPDTPVPYSPPLEEAFLPNVNTLLAAARKLVKY